MENQTIFLKDPQSTGTEKVHLKRAPSNERKCSKSRKRDHGRCWPDWMGFGSCKEQLLKKFEFFKDNETQTIWLKVEDGETQELSPDKFCIIIDEDKSGENCIVPEYCEKKQKLL